MKNSIYMGLIGYFCLSFSVVAFGVADLPHLQEQVRQAGNEMLEDLEVSYVYGGGKVGEPATCEACNQCLEISRPAPKDRIKVCPQCKSCSLDCSHFAQLVFYRAGLPYPYLTTNEMADLTPPELERKYGLIAVSSWAGNVIPGDLLVYPGHVVIVENVRERNRGDIIHATGGRDIKEPGQGIQRERFVYFSRFRGDLRRVLRHKDVEKQRLAALRATSGRTASLGSMRVLRPVEKKNP